jgi:hypothetical protein
LNYLEVAKIGSELRAAAFVGGVPTEPVSVDYDAAMHAWWRIREDGGTIYFEVSGDGVTYDALASTPAPFSVSALELSLIAGTHPSSITQEQARFDRFNLPP